MTCAAMEPKTTQEDRYCSYVAIPLQN
jgi:hypothetical protein